MLCVTATEAQASVSICHSDMGLGVRFSDMGQGFTKGFRFSGMGFGFRVRFSRMGLGIRV